MVRYYNLSVKPGGERVEWRAGATRPVLRLDVPDESGVWPAGRIQKLSGGNGGPLHLRILPEGGDPNRDLVAVFLSGYAFEIVEEINVAEEEIVRLPTAQVLAMGKSQAAHVEGILLAAWLHEGQALIVEEIPYKRRGESRYWVFSAQGAERLSHGELVAQFCPDKAIEL